MDETEQGGLTRAVHAALTDQMRSTPTAELAVIYATQIDEASHLPLALEKHLRALRAACELYGNDKADDALDKVTAALSAVTVIGDLGPKLLAALDALLLTPKAKASLERKLGGGAEPANPLEALREQQDELKARRDRRSSAG